MFTLLIATFNEPRTLKRILLRLLSEKLKEDCKILVVAPDKNSEKVVSLFPGVYFLKDKGKGKPAALNFALPYTSGDILVLTDGDVLPAKGSVQRLVSALRENADLGAVTGRPVPVNSRESFWGFTAHFLTNAAHKLRKERSAKNRYLECSGYLYACRRALFPKIPDDILAEDSFVSQEIYRKGYRIGYVPQALVFVKFPTNFSDWIAQKRRSTGGYIQKYIKSKAPKSKPKTLYALKARTMRGFWSEIFEGIRLFFAYPKNLKEVFFILILYLARLYLWLNIFWHLKIQKHSDIWQRIESTK